MSLAEIPLHNHAGATMARKKPGKAKKPKAKAAPKERNEPARWQEAHSPTVPVIIGINGKRTDSGARRRKDDAELVMDLDNAEVQAAEELRDAYFAIVGDLAVKGSSYGERLDRPWRGAGLDLPESDRTTHHRQWVKLCRRPPRLSDGRFAKGIDVHAVHEVVCEGYSCRAVDQARGRRKGWAAAQVHKGLGLWDDARPRRRRDARIATIAESCQAA